MFAWILGLINPLSRLLKTIDNKVDNETERERIKSETIQSFLTAQVQQMGTSNWLWVALPFVLITSLYYCAVVIYSIFWCKGCMYPQPWIIAELPPKFMEWAGWIVSSIFLYKGVDSLVNKFRR